MFQNVKFFMRVLLFHLMIKPELEILWEENIFFFEMYMNDTEVYMEK